MTDVKKWLWDGAKTVFRVAFLGTLSALISYLTELITGANIPLEYKGALFALLAGADKSVFEWLKETKSRNKVLGIEWKGISPA